MVKFAHLSDCHIGGWREEKLRELSIESFSVAAEKCIEENVDFVVIAGDLFNTSVPSIDALKMVTSCLKKLHDNGIRVYVIPGSHDYSPSGKTMLEVLERSGLCKIVFKFDRENGKLEITTDEKTGVKLAGMVGLRGGLEKFDYMKLDKMNLEDEKGVKIFLFHSLITEFKPVDFDMVDSEPLMSLPKGFNYYAGGHPHMVFKRDMTDDGYGMMAYPGPLFPNNFKELETLQSGGFYIVEIDKDGRCNVEHNKIELKRVVPLVFDAEGKSAADVTREIRDAISKNDTDDAVVTVRVEGCIGEGKTNDIPFKEIFDKCGAYIVLKNTYKLISKEFAEVNVQSGSVSEIEDDVMRQQVKQFNVNFLGKNDGNELAKLLMNVFDKEKLEGERVNDFEGRVFSDAVKELGLNEVLKRAD